MTVSDTNKTRGKARHYWDMKTSLTDRYCKTVTEEGKHGDGGGLYLHVIGERKYWRLATALAANRRLPAWAFIRR